MKALEFTHEKGPCAATFSNVFRWLNVGLLEEKLGGWAESVLRALKASTCDLFRQIRRRCDRITHKCAA